MSTLVVGKMCTKKLHRINSQDDLMVCRRSTGSIWYRCRECKRVADKRHRDAKAKQKDGRNHTLLGRGRCRYDHPLRSEADVVVVRHQFGKPVHACRACKEDPDKATRLSSVDKPHPLLLGCGCRPHFRPPLPSVGDFIYCSLHNTGTEVLRWV